MTPVAEYSSIVSPDEQASSTGDNVFSLQGFLNGLGALATPIATVVAANQAAKNQPTTNTGDGIKAPAPVVSTPTLQSGGVNQRTLLFVGLGLAAVVAVALIVRKS